MVQRRLLIILVAAFASAPGAVIALAGGAYIIFSIVTEPWYRSAFLDYGLKLVGLYIAFLCGMGVAAAITLDRVSPRRSIRLGLLSVVVTGVGAALMLELQFWSQAHGGFWPRGLFIVPYICWAVCAMLLSKLRKRA